MLTAEQHCRATTFMAHQTTEHAIALANAQAQIAEAGQALQRAAQALKDGETKLAEMTTARDGLRAELDAITEYLNTKLEGIDAELPLLERLKVLWQDVQVGEPLVPAPAPADSEGGEPT